MTSRKTVKASKEGPAACADIAATMVGHLVNRLTMEASKQGGALTAEEIGGVARRFIDDNFPDFQATFGRSYEACMQARDVRDWSEARRRPFDRLLMKRFAHLFPARRGDDGGSGLLSRRIIPGVSLALDKMIGPSLYEQCQQKSLEILDRYHRSGGGFDWDKVHDDPEARAMVNDVLALVAHSFIDFPRRSGWFMELVNSRLSPPATDEADALWTLTEYRFGELMRALFAELREAYDTRPEAVRDRYGGKTMTVLAAFFEALDKA